MGTLPYMAPEQIEGRAADQRSDIFALGAVMHEMVDGPPGIQRRLRPLSLTSSILTFEPAPIDGLADRSIGRARMP